MVLKNILSVLSASCIAAIASLLLNHYSSYQLLNWLYIVCAYCFLFLLLNILYNHQVGSKNFTQVLIFSFSVKLLLAFCVVFIYSVLFIHDFFSFSVHFLLHYFIFTAIEIIYLVQLIKLTKKIKT